ncbi:PRD domain-containing protein [Caproiciproducens sp.]
MIRDTLKLKTEDYQPFLNDLDYAENFITENGIELTEKFRAPFCNHLVIMLSRLRARETVDMQVDDSMREELREDMRVLAERMLTPLFEKYRVPYSESEVFLIALYFQSAIKNNSEEERF